MCDSCSIDQAALAELVAEQAADEEALPAPDQDGEFVADHKPPNSYCLNEASAKIDRARPVWVSAGPTATDLLNADDDSPVQSPDLLVRDAIGQLARAFFDKNDPLPIIVAWDAAISPVLLDVASRFGGGTQTLVWVVVTPRDMKAERRAIGAADWRRGAIVPLASHNGVPRTVIAERKLRAVVFIGGRKSDVGEDADALSISKVPRYAIASTGGVAEDLLTQDGSTYGATNPTVGNLIAVPGSYLELFHKVATSLP